MIARKNALNSISAIKRPHQATSNRLRIATEYAELHAGRVVSRVTQDEEFLLMDNKIHVTQLGEVGTTNQLTNPIDRAKKKTTLVNISILVWIFPFFFESSKKSTYPQTNATASSCHGMSPNPTVSHEGVLLVCLSFVVSVSSLISVWPFTSFFLF